MRKIKISYSNIVFTFIFCGLYFGNTVFMNFATDTYWAFVYGADNLELVYIASARFFPALLCKVWYLLQISNEIFYYVISIMALIFLFFSIYLFQYILREIIKSNFFRICVSFIAVANIFIIEYFMFLEKAIFMFAIFFNIVALYCIVKYFQLKKVKFYLLSLLCMLVAVFTYQATVGLFVVLCLPFLFKFSNNLKEYIQNGFLVLFNFGFVGVANYVVLVLGVKSSRVPQGEGLLKNLLNVFTGLKEHTITTFDIFPPYIFIFLLILVIGANIINILVYYNSNPIRLWCQMFNLLVLFIGTAIISSSTIIISGWFCPRVLYPYASIIGIYIINLYANIYQEEYNTKKYKDKFLCIYIFIYLTFQYICFSRIYLDKYINNYVDQYRCLIIDEQIKNYEKETQNTIRYISFYQDKERDTQYAELFRSRYFAVSSFTTNWSDLESINYYTNSTYQRVDMDPNYQSYFLEKDWKFFSNEQLIFDGDTLHLCIY